jgi:mRNA-degrading endonuclease toxin of MazEF toxin-antitoxin module
VKRKGKYVPERADAVWITLDPQAGREQAGRRPGLKLTRLNALLEGMV